MSKKQTSCYKTPNNIFLNCPALMQDGGRSITDFRSRYDQNHPSNFPGAPENMSSYEYAQFIKENGTKILDAQRKRINMLNTCPPRSCSNKPVIPPRTILQCDKKTCTTKLNDENGFGMHVDTGYANNVPSSDSESDDEQSDLHMNYCGTDFSDAMFYPLDWDVKDEYPRVASPGGGVPLHANSRTLKQRKNKI